MCVFLLQHICKTRIKRSQIQSKKSNPKINQQANANASRITKVVKQTQSNVTTKNSYAKLMPNKCFKCGEPRHQSNEFHSCKFINLADYSEDINKKKMTFFKAMI